MCTSQPSDLQRQRFEHLIVSQLTGASSSNAFCLQHSSGSCIACMLVSGSCLQYTKQSLTFSVRISDARLCLPLFCPVKLHVRFPHHICRKKAPAEVYSFWLPCRGRRRDSKCASSDDGPADGTKRFHRRGKHWGLRQ